MHHQADEHHINDTDIPLSQRNDTIELIEYYDGFSRILQSRSQAEDLIFGHSPFGNSELEANQSQPVVESDGQMRDSTDPPHVVVDGWQIYDNKARVVEKYEPFYSQGWEYTSASDKLLGQKIAYFFDPRGQQIRTVYPNQSEDLVVQGVPNDLDDPFTYIPTPWESYNYDSNDNAGRTHPVESIVYQSHWQTPESVRIDARGREIETIQRNGANPATDWYRVVSTYDIRGNLLTLINPLGQASFEILYDLQDQVIRTKNIDAGIRCRILNAAGNLIEQRDSKGSLILKAYDKLNRPLRTWARDRASESATLRELLIYGDALDSELTPAQATDNNLLGNLFRQYDEAGLLEISSYDFKGNILEKSRMTIRDDVILSVFTSTPVNWQINTFCVNWQHLPQSDLDTHAATLLDATSFQTSLQYDALNRVKRMHYPEDVDQERKELLPGYNRAGALESVSMDGNSYVQHIAYNAKGQRTLIAYGNDIMTRYTYDPLTFRLRRMRTERYIQPNPLIYHPQGQALQDMRYEYDLHGNMLSLHDRAPGSGITPQLDQLDREFVYDPIYRLLTATGRECELLNSTPPWQDVPRCTDIAKMLPYTESYQYDALGNMKRLQHQVNGGGFTRNFTLVTGTNQLDALQVGLNSYQYQYDSNGNLIQENASRFFEWNHNDRLRSFRTQIGNSEPSIYTHYVYDAAGLRVKQVTRKSATNVASTTYIDEMFEYHREHLGGTTRNNNHLHIMDNEKRIAIRRIGNPFSGNTGPAVQYHLGDHLGSSHLVIDETSAWTNREEFTPFGETSFGSFAKKRYRYTDKEKDEESGMYYMGARYYSPSLGRWLNIDPLAIKYSHESPYVFVSNNPLIYIDPDGLEKIVVSGGEYTDENRYKYNFIEPAIKQLKTYKKNAGNERVTWLVINLGYSQWDIVKFQRIAKQNNAVFGLVSSAKDLSRYINRQRVNSNGITESRLSDVSEVSADRIKDPVTGLTIFGHGFTGSMEFGYRQSGSAGFSYGKKELNTLSPKSFNNATIDLYTCNAATPTKKADGLWSSFAGQLASKTKTKVVGFFGRTDYAKMNTGRSIREKIARKLLTGMTNGSKKLPVAGRKEDGTVAEQYSFDERKKTK